MVRTEHDGHQLSGEIACMDPMLRKLQILKRLKELADANSEDAFNFERRVYKYHKRYELIFQSESRLRGEVYTKDAVTWSHECPACGFHEMQMYHVGAVRDDLIDDREVYANCMRCDFTGSSKEQEHMIPAGYPTLVEIYDDLVESGGK